MLIVQNVAYGLSHIPIVIYSMKQIEKLLGCVRDAMTSTLKINVKKARTHGNEIRALVK